MTPQSMARTFRKALTALWLVSSCGLGTGCAGGPSTNDPPGGMPNGATGGSATSGAGGTGAAPAGGAGGTGTVNIGGAIGGGADASSPDTGAAGRGGSPDAGATADGRPPADGAVAGDAARDAGATAPDAGSETRPDAGVTDSGLLPPTTIWLAGDSTVQNYLAGNVEGNGGTTLEGWGQELAPFFNDRVTVNNQAIGGRSVAFFMWAVQRDAAGNYLCVDDQGNPLYQLDASGNHVDTSQWARIKAGIKAGDFLLIQFGTNDETHDCPRFVSLPDFETDLGFMADTVRAKGATPIFVTPMGHRSFVGTAVNNTLLPYANAMKAEAAVKSVQVADLNLRSVEYYATVGNAFLATNIFDTGTTHFIQAGAIKMASLVAGEIRARGGALAAYLR